jgi:hypothetical protein
VQEHGGCDSRTLPQAPVLGSERRRVAPRGSRELDMRAALQLAGPPRSELSIHETLF